tara:strand:+ start:185 stop:1285 length:1101 start_codon:yes stop_codon:yes gene_type:complete
MKNKYRIILVSSKAITLNLFFGEFIKILKSNNVDITLATSDIENLLYYDVSKIKLYLPKNKYEFFNLFKIIYYFYMNFKYYNKFKDNIILLNTPLASHFLRLNYYFTNINFYYFVHGFRFHPNGNYIINLFFKIIEIFLKCKTNLYFVINKYDQNFVLKKFKKPYFFLNGIGISEKYLNNKIALKKEFKKKFIIGCIGAYRKNKGYYDLIYIAEKLKMYKNIKIVCFGYDDPSQYQKIITNKKLNNIILNSFTDNIFNEIKKFDLFVHLSNREGFPISLIQCMSLGIPSLSYNIRGCNDIIINDHNGFLFEFNELNKIENKIIELMNNKDIYNKIVFNSKKTIDIKFSSKQVGKILFNKLFNYNNL